MIEKDVITDFSPTVSEPVIGHATFVHPLAAVIGGVVLGNNVMVSPGASIRGDEGWPLYVGNDSNVQDGVVIHALETELDGKPMEQNIVLVNQKPYAVYVGERVTLAHQALVHGPAAILDDTFVGMRALIFRAIVGSHCVVEPGALIMGVTVHDGRYVPAGAVVTSQEKADLLPFITDDYPMKDMNKGVLHVNKALAKGYLKASILW
ncbi:MAG: UDP-3-O-(3-hydroxymyristoyl) glucosamine N-acyltransferase [Syntrophus sp. PtaU1.Bin208]|nr:MAG: UDP-3-O-(3-hydroxymyristoyl) glucosamine N-acyltransferase [Syntrophus sp. PtaU1.Bin208]